MNGKMVTWIVMGVWALALGASAQGPTGQIRTIDLNKVFNDYYKTPIATAKLKETFDSYKKEREDMFANYRKQIDELNKLREEQDRPEYTTEVRDQKRKAVGEKLAETQKLQRDIEEYDTSHRKILDEQSLRMRQTILKEINDVIGKEARDQGYLLVVDKSGNTANGVPGIVFAQDSLDISGDIVKVLNKNQPKTVEAPKPAEKKDEKKDEKK